MSTHPLDKVFNINVSATDEDFESKYGELGPQVPAPVEPGSQPEPVKDVKDADDELVEKNIDEIYAAAMEAFNKQTEYTEIIEPRYAARNAEVAANYLTIALNASMARARTKVDRKRANQQAGFVPYAQGGKTTNNFLIANREEILKMIPVDDTTKKV